MADKNEKPIVPDAGEELNDDNPGMILSLRKRRVSPLPFFNN